MIGIEALDMAFAAGFGGLFGSAISVLALRQYNRFNIQMLEEYWNQDIKRLNSIVEVLESKISTITVDKAVNNAPIYNGNNGYKPRKHIKQGA